MALSIRNPKAEELAREVAAEARENITQAIIHALEERLERIRGRRTAADIAEEIMKISQRCRTIPEKDSRTPQQILGYDEKGTP